MLEAEMLLQQAAPLVAYLIPTIIGLSIVIFADVIYHFMRNMIVAAKKFIRFS